MKYIEDTEENVSTLLNQHSTESWKASINPPKKILDIFKRRWCLIETVTNTDVSYASMNLNVEININKKSLLLNLLIIVLNWTTMSKH